ncbi:MAG: DNA primase [Anaerolineales bacterium]|nr:DNA primase [Anaerolineales bacterium]
MSVVDEIKDRIDIVEVVSESVKLRKTGKNYTGFCPFHPNTRTPAFVIFPDTGTWRCFGACTEGGDVFGFLMKKEGWDFPEALRYLAERAGVELKPQTSQQRAEEESHHRLRELLEAAVTFYRHNLFQSQPGQPVLEYLQKRNLTTEILEIFEIGYAPDSWDATRTYMLERKYSERELIETGMVSERDSGGTYDRFRNRIMIPIRDSRGRISGFGARIVDPEDVPKFLNSPQTVLFDKGRMLYGLDKSKKAIRSSNQAVIVEGYMDVIALNQAGFGNAVSPMGTAISEHQLRLVKRFSRNIVLALDPDVAGIRATMRGLNVARDALDREADPVFDARGLLRNEGRLDADIRVVTLPGEKDPDEVVADDPEEWSRLLEKAKTIVDYVLDVLSEGQDIDDPKVKSSIAGQVMPLIDDVADSVERETYRQHLARRLRVDERALINWRPKRNARRRVKPGDAPPVIDALASRDKDAPLERFCLGLLIENPELLYRIDRQLQALQMERLSELDFSGTVNRIIFQSIQQALAQDEEEPAQYWRGVLDESLHEVAEGMSVDLSHLKEFVGMEMEQPKVADEIAARFLQLRKRSLEENLSKIQFLLKVAEEPDQLGDEVSEIDIVEYKSEVQRHALQKARLEQALARRQGSLLNT